MISALALFQRAAVGYSRIPFVLADDGLLPKALGKLDAHGTPRTAVIGVGGFLFILRSGFVRQTDRRRRDSLFGCAFPGVRRTGSIRKTEPTLRGVFRIPLSRRGVAALASMPMIVLVGVICVSLADGEYGLPAVIGSAIAIAAGPLMYRLAVRRGTRLGNMEYCAVLRGDACRKRVERSSLRAMDADTLGQLIMTGVPGKELDAETARLFRRVQPGAYILFGRNLESAMQLRKLIDDFAIRAT